MINKGIIQRSISHYGKDRQTTVCMEECAELIQVISKNKRDKINNKHLAEEIADVLICIEMLKAIYNISDEMIDKWIFVKQIRTMERMENDNSR